MNDQQDERIDQDTGEVISESRSGLNAALDQLEEKHTLFGGGIETVAFEHPGTRRRSALAHTRAAGETAVKAAREGLAVAFRAVI